MFNTSCAEKQQPAAQMDQQASQKADQPVNQTERIQQLEKDVCLLGERVYELEEQLKGLQRSHELAVFVNQDLDERLSRVEGKSR